MAEVSLDALARLAARRRPQTQVAPTDIHGSHALLVASDADLTDLQIIPGPAKPYNGGTLWTLSKCPFSDDHTDGAFRILFPDGGIYIGCHHNRCSDKTITRAPELFPRTTSLLRGVRPGISPLASSPRSPDIANTERAPILLPLTEVTEKSIDWLWRGWLARSMLTILGGYAGDGKSTIAMDLIARFTVGGALPDGTPAPRVNVLILAAEDDPEYAIKPRLRVHGADMSRVFILKGVASADGKAEWFNLRRDIDAMRDAIADRSIDLVLIDPLSSYMPKADRNSEGDVRDALAPLQELMDQTGVGVLGIMHVGKGDGKRRAALRLLGSTAFVALARCVWMVHELPGSFQPGPNEGDDELGGIRKVLGVVKANYSLKPPALAWSRTLDAPIDWHGQSPIGIEEAFAEEGPHPAPKRAESETFLRELLKGGSKPAREVFKAARDRGISDNTLRAAATKVGIEKVKDGYQGSWLWSLPRDTALAGGQTGVANDAKDTKTPTRGPSIIFGRHPHAPIAPGTPKDVVRSLQGMNGIFGENGNSPSQEQGTRDATWEDF